MPFRSISIRAKLALSAAALTAFAIVAVIALTTSLMTRDSARESEADFGRLITSAAFRRGCFARTRAATPLTIAVASAAEVALE